MAPRKGPQEGAKTGEKLGSAGERPGKTMLELEAQKFREGRDAKLREFKAQNAEKIAGLKGKIDISPEEAAVAETTDSWKPLAGGTAAMDQLGKNMENFSTSFSKFLEKISAMIDKIFGGTASKDVFDEKTKTVDAVKAKEKIRAQVAREKVAGEASMDPEQMTDYGAKIHTLWCPEDPKNVMNWFCSIKKVQDSQGNVYLADSNGVQSFGRFQFNNGYLQQFVGYIKKTNPEYLDQLSSVTKQKVLSIAGKGQHKGDYSNFLTNAEGREFLETVLRPHAELEYNFRGKGFFENQLPSILKFQSEFPRHTDFINQMGADQRYLAVILDISNQCGPGGARKVIKYVLSHLGENTHPSPAQALQLFLDGGSGSVNSGHENARKIRTIYCFISGSGRETGFPFKFAQDLLREFQGATGAQKEAILKTGSDRVQKT